MGLNFPTRVAQVRKLRKLSVPQVVPLPCPPGGPQRFENLKPEGTVVGLLEWCSWWFEILKYHTSLACYRVSCWEHDDDSARPDFAL